jgi:hypothetical protein
VPTSRASSRYTSRTVSTVGSRGGRAGRFRPSSRPGSSPSTSLDEHVVGGSRRYLIAKSFQTIFIDPERGRAEGMKQFLDEKAYKPGLGAYKRYRK